MKHLGDITKISGYTAPVVDCIIGGSPCQDLSVAGKRAGLEGERSGLFMEQIRIVKEMRKQDEANGRTDINIRPRYMVWENVPGAFSSNKGEDFRVVLEEIAKVKDENASIPMPKDGKWTTSGSIVGDGWSISWRVLDAQFWGVPQRRRRIALVADFGGESSSEILFVSKSLSGHLDESQPKRKDSTSDATRGFRADDSLGFDGYNAELTGDKQSTSGVNCGMSTGRNGVITFEPGIASREGGHIYEGVSGTIRANAGDNQMATAYEKTIAFNMLQDPVPNEKICPCIGQGNSKGGQASIGIVTFDARGNGDRKVVPTLVGDHEMRVTDFTSLVVKEDKPVCFAAHGFGNYENMKAVGSLMCGQNSTVRGDTPLVVKPVYVVDQSGGKSSCDVREGKSPTLTTTHDGATVIALDRASFNQGKNAQYDFDISDKGINSPLVAKGPGAVCYWDGGQVVGTLTANNASGCQRMPDKENFNCVIQGVEGNVVAVDCRNGTESEVNGALQSNSAHSLNGNNLVRTRYIVRRLTPLECERLQGYPDGWTDIGEYIDSNGKKRQTSDASRYKALGNSIALPPWKWVLKRICACYERDATMASLFDGIGGFPLIWEQLNGKGSCLWASEIEEFPMAVTKVRIGE